MDMLYQLDLSPAQLADLRGMAPATAGAEPAAAPRGYPRLIAALKQSHDALLAGNDDDAIAKSRNAVVDWVTANPTKLNDDVPPTDAARADAPVVCRSLAATQIAAYLAGHADEVEDPVEELVDTAAALGDSDPSDQTGIIQDAADDVGRLVAGMDDAKAKAISDRAAAWLEANKDAGDSAKASLEASAKALVGNVSPMDVLDHWMQLQMVTLLSNPQLAPAIDEMSAAPAQQQNQ
ncbi:MAG TPA: hypothetical protein VMD30_00245, partial [Tepidisphaeraceae bacterium]|nr:hypothetical protein [Tepidisphaeraceae bacterium]